MLASVLNNPTTVRPRQRQGQHARRSRSATATCWAGWPSQGTISAAARPSRPRGSCRCSRRSRPRASTAARRGHMLELVRDELHRLGYSDEQIDGEGLRVTTTFTPKAMQAAAAGRDRGPARRLQRQEAAHRGGQRRAGHRRAARLLRRPGLPAVAAQLGGDRRRAGLDVQAVRAGDRARGRLLPQGHLRRQLAATTTTSRAPATGCATRAAAPTASATTTARAVNLTTRDRGVDQHRVRRPDPGDPERAAADPRHRHRPGHPDVEPQARTPTTTSTTARASSRSRGIALGSATDRPDQHGQRLRHDRQRRPARPTCT